MSSDNYQAVFDAVRASFRNVDFSHAVQSALDFSYQKVQVVQAVQGACESIAVAHTRPSALFRPELSYLGITRTWHAKYGDVIGAGLTPGEAMRSFDERWEKEGGR